jgi:hypothetical protein
MKRLLVVLLFALASLVLVPSALSDPPTIQRFPIDASFVDDVDCAFPVQVDIVGTDLRKPGLRRLPSEPCHLDEPRH